MGVGSVPSLDDVMPSLSATLDPCMSVTEGEVRVKLINNIHANTRLHLSRSEPVDLPAVSCRVLLKQLCTIPGGDETAIQYI
jgi:hypothetical protein